MNVIKAVGNYGEVFERNLEPIGIQRGPNALWTTRAGCSTRRPSAERPRAGAGRAAGAVAHRLARRGLTASADEDATACPRPPPTRASCARRRGGRCACPGRTNGCAASSGRCWSSASSGPIVWWLWSNTVHNLEVRRIATGFGFLGREAGLPIGESLIDYSPTDTYLPRADWSAC